MKRTTLILNETRLVELKRLAAAQGQTLSALVDQFLAAGLERDKSARSRRPPRRLPSYSMGRPRVNLADRDQLEELLRDR